MSKRSLYIADDSIAIQKVIDLTFAEEGYQVRSFGDGDSMQKALGEALPDIVLADANMPGADGYSICQEIRGSDRTRDIPVILLVGSFEPFDKERAEQVGANTYFTKPFQSLRQLVDQVNDLVSVNTNYSSGADSVVEESVSDGEPVPDQPFAVESDASLSDIDSLYENSMSPPRSNAPDDIGRFTDVDSDDEMIETSYHSELAADDTLDFDIVADPSRSAATEISEGPAISDYFSHRPESNPPTFSEDDRAEQMAANQPEDPPERVQESFGQPVGLVRPEEEDNRSSVFDIPPPLARTPAAAEQDPFDTLAIPEYEPASQMGIDTVSFDRPNEQEFGSRELDLLDLPPFEGNETVELTTGERAELMGSSKRVISLSPELIDAIAEKVVEKLSQKY